MSDQPDHTPPLRPSSPSGSLEPKRRDAAKSMFLVAYSATSKTITQEMMQESGLCPMECHSLEYDGFKYSFVKLYKRAREGQIKAFMLHAITTHGVEQDDEVEMLNKGTRAIVSCEKKSSMAFAEHPAMQRIRAKLANPSTETAIESWKDATAPTKKRLIGQFVDNADEETSKASMVRMVSELEATKKAHKDLETRYIQLESDNHHLQEKYHNVKKELRSSKRRLTAPDEAP